MSNERLSEVVDDQPAEVIETRNRHLENFAQWMIQSGLSPLDYELVEENRSDGIRLWYFRKRSEEIQNLDKIEF